MIEESSEVLPNIGITVLSQALIIESVDLCDLLALVISSQDSDSVWVSDLKSNKEGNGLDWVVSSIDVISHEQVVVVW